MNLEEHTLSLSSGYKWLGWTWDHFTLLRHQSVRPWRWLRKGVV